MLLVLKYKDVAERCNYEITLLKKIYRLGFLLLSIISFFEILLIGLTLLQPTRDVTIQLYLYGYAFLLLCSMMALVLLNIFKDTVEKNYKKILLMTIIYRVCIVLWAVYMSTIDS